jgi:hypothetical protein
MSREDFGFSRLAGTADFRFPRTRGTSCLKMNLATSFDHLCRGQTPRSLHISERDSVSTIR